MKASDSPVEFVADTRRTSSSALPVTDWRDGLPRRGRDCVVTEEAVALAYNGRSHVVMMATPEHLDEFGLGFSLTERIIVQPDELLELTLIPGKRGTVISMRITTQRFESLERMRRNLTGRTGCGLCGAESLEQAIREPNPVPDRQRFSHRAVQRALAGLAGRQPLQQATGGSHGAAWCETDGEIALLREDVGRHNALDKLCGVLQHPDRRQTARPGFITVTSRASYEMVLKAAAMQTELLVALSAPTQLAVALAERANITLVAFARPGRHRIYSHPRRLVAP